MNANANEKVRRLTGWHVLTILLTFFGVVFGVNALLTTLAIKTLSGTEVASAYAASLAYKDEIEAARQQRERHWRVTAQADRRSSSVTGIKVEARGPHDEPLNGIQFTARLQRPVDKRLDHLASLHEVGQGAYVGELQDIESGQWDLVIEGVRDGDRLFRSSSRIWLN